MLQNPDVYQRYNLLKISFKGKANVQLVPVMAKACIPLSGNTQARLETN